MINSIGPQGIPGIMNLFKEYLGIFSKYSRVEVSTKRHLLHWLVCIKVIKGMINYFGPPRVSLSLHCHQALQGRSVMSNNSV